MTAVTDIKRGDVLELGRHRLMCGDAFSAEDVDALLRGEKPDMLYCDPPYGIRVDTRNQGGRQPHAKWGRRGDVAEPEIREVDYPPVIGDSKDFDPRPLIALFDDCREQFWWGAHFYAERLPQKNDGSWFCWDKRGKGNLDKVHGNHFEMCWSRMRHKSEIIRVLWCGIYGMNGLDKRRHHPTQKPVAVAEWFLERYSKDGALIVDLFAGSGSTLLAAERMGRRALVMEISPDYCQVIVDRYRSLTKQPSLLEIA
jgi:DNA modification methylase